MKAEIPCPACRQPISLWQIMKAPTPFHMSCSNCKSKVRVKDWTWPGLGISCMLGAFLGVAVIGLHVTDSVHIIIGLVIAAAIMMLGELIAGLLIINKGSLVLPGEDGW